MEEESFADQTAYLRTASIFGFQGRKELLVPLPHRKSYIAYTTGGPTDPYFLTDNGKRELDYWNSGDGQTALKSIESPAILLTGLTDLITSLSDEKTIECLKVKHGGLRDFVELSSPTTQCGNTVGILKPDETDCWICGGKIPRQVSKTVELTAECEHVFPIAQALCFSGLYESQLYNQLADESPNKADAYRKGVSYEYKWAHRICNQIKNDTHFIEYRDNKFSINQSRIEAFLQSIQNTTKYGTGALLMETLGNGRKRNEKWRDWITNRTAEIYKISQTLIDYANTSGLTVEQHAKVTLMCVRSFLATDPTCASLTEVVPETVVKRGYVGDLPTATMKEPVAAAKHFIASVTEQTTGMIHRILGQIGREISAQERGLISAWLAESSLKFREHVENKFTTEVLNAYRFKLMYYLKGKETNDTVMWSKFLVGTNQVIAGEIYAFVVRDGVSFLKTLAEPNSNVSNFLNSPKLAQGLEGWLASKIAIIKQGGVPFDEIVKTSSNTDPTPNIPIPGWFEYPRQLQTGGGKGLPERFSTMGGSSHRRPLYPARRKTYRRPRSKKTRKQ